MENQSQIVAVSSKMEKDWRKDVKGMAFAVADLSSILEILLKEDNPDECIGQAPNLHEKLRQVACRLIDSCVPICQELERAEMARSATPKEETKLGEVAEVNEKSSAPSLKETDAPDLVPNINSTPPEDEEEKEVSVSNQKEKLPSHEADLPALDLIIPEKTNDEITEPAEKEENKLSESIIQGGDQKSPEVDLLQALAPAIAEKVNETVPEKEKKTSVEAVGENPSAKNQVLKKAKARKAKKSVPNSATVSKQIDETCPDESTSPVDVPTIILEKSDATVPEDKEETKTPVEAVRETNPSLKAAKSEEEFQVVSKKTARKAKKPVPASTITVPKVEEVTKQSFVEAVKVSAPAKPLQRVVIPIEKQNNVDVKLEVKVPAEKVGFVIGKLFTNIKRLEKDFGVKVTLPAKGGSDIWLTGPADKAAAAKEDILGNLPWTTDYPLQKGLHGAILGPKGDVINGLRKEHNVIIILNHENVIIRGCKKQCDAALTSIKSIVAKQREVFAARAAGIIVAKQREVFAARAAGIKK